MFCRDALIGHLRSIAALFLLLAGLPAAGRPCLADEPSSATAAGSANSATAAQGAANVLSGQPGPADHSFLGRDSLTDHFFGLGDKASDAGVDAKLSMVQIYQQLLGGGAPGNEHAGLYSGRYDLELKFNLEKILGLPGGHLYILNEGDWGRDIQPDAGSVSNPNYNLLTGDPTFVRDLYYEQTLGGPNGDLLTVRVGKVDLTAAFTCSGCPLGFDGNRYANDETSQFLNSVLCNNPAFPFPDPGPGAMALLRPTDWWYFSAGVGNARARITQADLGSTFRGDEGRYFGVGETGFLPQLPSASGPLAGAYRLGVWYDDQAKLRLDGAGEQRGDRGLYTSFDQKLWNSDQQDRDRGPGVFFRFGAADAAVDAVKSFYSAGLQYQGLLPGRNGDVVAVAFGAERLANEPEAGFGEPGETVVETYYNIQLTPWCHLSPDVQYIFNPGGGTGHAARIGLRLQVVF